MGPVSLALQREAREAIRIHRARKSEHEPASKRRPPQGVFLLFLAQSQFMKQSRTVHRLLEGGSELLWGLLGEKKDTEGASVEVKEDTGVS